jgi:hypothetical protein
MKKHSCAIIALACVTLASSRAQTPTAPERPRYLDIMAVKVRPEKHADFDALMRKAVEANSRHKGDHWITWNTAYGEGHTYYITTPRASMADVEKGYGNFMRALKESWGPAVEKLGHDFHSCLQDSRNEIRLFRWDLSRNVPESFEETMRILGNTRWIRTIKVSVRRAKRAQWEAALPEFRDAMPSSVMGIVTEAMVGDTGEFAEYYVSTYFKSMGEMDAVPPTRERMGEELYRKFQLLNNETVARVSTHIIHPAPRLSNPPEVLVNAARDFWRPAPMAVTRKAITEKAK